MASTWAGFTDDDLREFKDPKPNTNGPSSEHKRAQLTSKKRQATKPRVRSQINQQIRNSETFQSNLSEQTLLQQTKPPVSSSGKRTELSKAKTAAADQGSSDRQEKKNLQENSTQKDDEEKELKSELDEKEVMVREMSTLDKFREQQKQIEEANKQKKALLAKAIEERKKAAKAETVKLIQIQNEMKHIDTLLTCDVSIIRDRIEQSSRDFLEAQKRYEKAEHEFIEAKMDLFHKSEQKEQLTEHLYTIIHQNELRKAKKLAELMQQLEMEISKEEMETTTMTSLPPLSMFSATPFQTLHSPTSPVKTTVPDEIIKNNSHPDSGESEVSKVSKDSDKTTIIISDSVKESVEGACDINDSVEVVKSSNEECKNIISENDSDISTDLKTREDSAKMESQEINNEKPTECEQINCLNPTQSSS